MTTEKPGCLTAILQRLGLASTPHRDEALPYRLRDDFLSSAELSFYHVLRVAVTDWAVVCPKVSLGDLFFAQTGNYSQNRSWMNRIERKHVDFLLCDPKTMRPLLGIELDDASHRRQKRGERDQFVEQTFAAAGLPLARVPVQAGYDTRELNTYLQRQTQAQKPDSGAAVSSPAVEPAAAVPKPRVPATPAASPLCPKCGARMVVREVTKEGPHKGKRFWGCPNFPKCRGIRESGGPSEQPGQA